MAISPKENDCCRRRRPDKRVIELSGKLAPELLKKQDLQMYVRECLLQANFCGASSVYLLPKEYKEARDLVIKNDDLTICKRKFKTIGELCLVDELIRSMEPIMTGKPCNSKEQTDEVWNNMTRETIQVNAFYLYFENTIRLDHPHISNAKRGTEVILVKSSIFDDKNREPMECYGGEIYEMHHQQIVIRFSKIRHTANIVPAFTINETFDIYTRPASFMYHDFCLICDKMSNEQTKDIFKKVYFPLLEDPIKVQKEFEQHEDESRPKKLTCFNRNLNDEQVLAVERIINQSPEHAFVLFGPPGTGKTVTLVEAVCQIAQKPDIMVLICTATNMAAESFAEALLAAKNIPENKILFAKSLSEDFNARNKKLDSITPIHTSWNGHKEFAPYGFILSDYKVIISTIGSVRRVWKYSRDPHVDPQSGEEYCDDQNNDKDIKFNYIIIDEAAQVSEPESLISLAYFGNSETRFVLAGDPMQLEPVITNRLLTETQTKYNISLLERLKNRPDYASNGTLMTQLVRNYRSHDSIVQLASDLFYNSTLVPTQPPGHDSFVSYAKDLGSRSPMFFYHVDGDEKKKGNSSQNEAEAKEVQRNVKELLALKDLNLVPSDIGIITPYVAQKRLVRQLLSEHKCITIETVEKFQGSERRVIVLTTVKTTHLGFMANYKRLNTAITRAKQLIIIIGNERCLLGDIKYKTMIERIKQNSITQTATGK